MVSIEKPAAFGAEPLDISFAAPVVEATLFEDRARVLRRGRAALPAGWLRLRIDGVAPVLADRTLTAALRGAPADTAVAEVRVVRSLRARDAERPEALGSLEARARELTRQLGELREREQRRAAELELLERAQQFTLAEVEADAARGRGGLESWRATLHALIARELAVRNEHLELRFAREELEREQALLQSRLAAATHPDASYGAAILVTLVTKTAGEVELEVGYVVPGACWRPAHTATLLPGPEQGARQVAMTMDGCVWQRTGEDWPDVQLCFSTQRPSLGTEPPLLGDDVLGWRRKQEAVVVDTREQEIQQTGLGKGSPRAAAELPGIDDGGEALNLAAPARATVPGDGRPYRVRLQHFVAEAEFRRVALAERAEAVLLECRLDHRGAHPLLAGPVELIADSGPVGRTTLRFVAPGERFRLGFGPDAGLRVTRRVERLDHPPEALSRWVRTDHKITVFFSNLGLLARSVEVTERIPVSEVEAVRVTFDREKSSAGAAVDTDGLVRWTVELPGDGTRKLELAYLIEKRKDVSGI